MQKLKHFKIEEFDCKVTGENKMSPRFLRKLDKLRARCAFPFIITSGYRSAEHPVEKAKKTPGTHTKGIAADIKAEAGYQKYLIVYHALMMGFDGIGVGKDFIHVDTRSTIPVIWTY